MTIAESSSSTALGRDDKRRQSSQLGSRRLHMTDVVEMLHMEPHPEGGFWSLSYICPAHVRPIDENVSGNLAHDKGKMTGGVVDHVKAMKLGFRTQRILDSWIRSPSLFFATSEKPRR